MIRFHVEFADQVSTFGGIGISGTTTSGGTFKAVVDYDGDDVEFFESGLDEDENVIKYSSEARA